MRVPIFKKQQKDELSYSWVLRLAEANGLSAQSFAAAYLGKRNTHIVLHKDLRREIAYLHQNTISNEPMNQFYIAGSTFPFESIFMTEQRQTAYLNNVFRERDALNPVGNTLFSEVHTCRECEKRDKEQLGFSYLHRKHQLNGVKVCYEHFVPFDAVDASSIEAEKAYAKYAADLLDCATGSSVGPNMSTVKQLIFSQFKERGYSAYDNYATLKRDLNNWEYQKLLTHDVVKFLKVKFIGEKYIDARELLPFIMFLFPKAIEFWEAVEKKTILEQEKCECCGMNYCITPYAKTMGMGCPSCEQKESLEERFARYVRTLDSEYEVKGNFVSQNDKVLILHKFCGETSNIRPRSFLYEGVRCKCNSIVTKAVAKKRIEEYKGYKLVGFENTSQPVTIYSKKCGHEFQCNYFKFLNFPGCRICKPKHMTAELYAERVESLVGADYTIVNGFVDQNTKIVLRHEICGQTQAYKPSRFLDGQRCSCCRAIEPEWEKKYQLLLEYHKENGNCNIPKRKAYKGVNLGIWVEDQRTSKKLSEKQREMLDALGFSWDPLEEEWNRRHEQLVRFFAEHELKDLKRRTDFEGEHLGAWVNTQKMRYRDGKLTPERVEKLKGLGVL